MKNASFLLLVFISSCFISCEKEKPENDEEPEDVIQESVVIDQSGGKLSIEGFELSIPSNAFTSQTELTLSLLNEGSVFTEDCISEVYLLEGLPAEIQKPLKIVIRYNGNLSEQNFIVVGEEAMNMVLGEEDIYYDFIPATDSSGFLAGEYASYMSKKKELVEPREKKWIKIQVVSNYLSEMKVSGSETYSYDLFIRKNVSNFKPEIIGCFDKAYKVFLSDFNFSYYFYLPLIGTPVNNILVTNLSEDVYCKYLWKMTDPSKPGGKFVINARKFDDMGKMGLMIAKEVFRSIFLQYSTSFPETAKPELIPETWLNQALITWSEEFFMSGEKNYLPSEFPGNELKPLAGLDYGTTVGEGSTLSKIMNYGNGMSAMIKFLSDDYVILENDTIWAYFYKETSGYEVRDPANILISSMNEIYNRYYYDYKTFINHTFGYWYVFIHEYLTGEVYNISPSVFLNSVNSERTFLIGSESDSVKTFKDDYPELSAQLYKVEFQNEEIRKNGSLEINLKGSGAKDGLIMVFALDNGKLKLLGNGKSLKLSELASYQTLLVAVGYDYFTDNHDTYTQLELELRYRQKLQLPYNYCTISTSVYRIRELNALENPDPEKTIVDTVLWNVKWYLKGEFTDYTFEGNIDAERQGGAEDISGGGIIKLDEDLNIIELHVNAHFEAEGYNSTWGLDSNQKLKMEENLGFMIKYVALENTTCNYIDYITGYYENFGYYDKTLDFYCGDISEFRVKFSID